MLSDRPHRVCAWVISEEIARRQRRGVPVPQALRDTLAAVNRELSVCGQSAAPVLSRLKTTEQLAAEWNCTPRTVRRRAAVSGARKIHGLWIFDEEDT